MKIWAISDSHGSHQFLKVPEVDIIIHAGDVSNDKDPSNNQKEFLSFLDWYRAIDCKYKILTAGNHDTSIEQGLISKEDLGDVIYLQHESIIIEGIKIFGSPYTPKFGKNWAFNIEKDQIGKYWEEITTDTQILITHGPPKGVLDLTKFDSRPGAEGKTFFQCGCESLLKRVRTLQPKYHIFGHIHTEEECPNSGMLQIQNCTTTFINASVCDFNRSYDSKVKSKKNINNNGYIIEI